MRRAFLYVVVSASFLGCAKRSTHIPPPVASAAPPAPYIDLKPGWRLRVITPLTKSGTYNLSARQAHQNGAVISLSASDDFLGYETSFYSLEPKGREGVRIRFTSARQNVNGVTTAQSEPKLLLFQLAKRAQHVRLLYLARVSQSDHDMAVLASARKELLDQKTALVRSDPKACEDDARTSCAWIPAGIAVRPEMPQAGADDAWVPAR